MKAAFFPLSRALAVVTASFTALIACVPEFDDDQATIHAPRILAVRSVPAEAKSGATVQLSALVAAPSQGSSPAETLEWAVCLPRKPLTELGPVAQECIADFGAGGESFQRLGRGLSVSATVPSDACRRFGPLSASTDPGGVAARPVDPDLSGGYHLPVVTGSDVGTALASVRLNCGVIGIPSTELVRFNQGYRPNENPEVERLELVTENGPMSIAAGADQPGATIRAGTRVELRATWAACPRQPVCGDHLCTAGENQTNCAEDCRDKPKGCTGAENYLFADPDSRTVKERREGVSVAWYSTAGIFVEEQTGRTERDPDGVDTSNHWTAPEGPGLVRLWVVLRDDRGGVGWNEYLVRVEPR